MPLDRMFDDSIFKRKCISWELKISIWPRRCHYTDRLIWFKTAYKGTAILYGPGDPVFEHRWVEKNQYLLEKIKGTI